MQSLIIEEGFVTNELLGDTFDGQKRKDLATP